MFEYPILCYSLVASAFIIAIILGGSSKAFIIMTLAFIVWLNRPNKADLLAQKVCTCISPMVETVQSIVRLDNAINTSIDKPRSTLDSIDILSRLQQEQATAPCMGELIQQQNEYLDNLSSKDFRTFIDEVKEYVGERCPETLQYWGRF